jgi:glycerol uptake facilitator-like aquaporin
VVRRAVAEALGTAFLLAAVVGSGIMGERMAGGNVAIALLANTIATGAMLVGLILRSARYPARTSTRLSRWPMRREAV